jgi:hypothetical protein
MRISPEYLRLNAALHEKQAGYGMAGWHWIGPTIRYMARVGARTILDYGAGKGVFGQWMPPEYPVTNYDPVTFPDEPTPQDFVVCFDVLEHVEPECLDDVLADIRRKMVLGGLLVIATRPAKKELPDGRNAHLIVKDKHFWDPKLCEHFGTVIMVPLGSSGELARFVRP